jgi:branched-chain amino acid transport system substrate-binding protein
MTRNSLMAAVAVAALGLSMPAFAQTYDTGASDTEIKLGNTNPYSGPASAYGTIGKSIEACMRKVNAEGGVNGRQINFITLDDGYSPPRVVEQTRRLVESEGVLGVVQGLGTPTQSAIHRYMNQRKVPQLFVATGATKWADPENYPWTMGWQPNYQSEGMVYAQYVLDNVEDPKIAILYQNDDYGKDYVEGLLMGLGDRAKELIVAEESYEVTDPTVDSQIVNLRNSGANVFYNVTTPKFAAQAIRRIHDLGWEPLHLLNSVSNSVGSVLTPAGLEASVGLVSAEYLKDPTDPAWQGDEDFKEWLDWMNTYYPDGDKTDKFNVYGYAVCATIVQVLKQMGDELTRENMMRQAANLKDFNAPMLLPGVTVNTSPTDFAPISQLQLIRFDGSEWVRFGPILDAAAGKGAGSGS